MALLPGSAQVAQLVEQRTENPRVGGSIPPLGTSSFLGQGATELSILVGGLVSAYCGTVDASSNTAGAEGYCAPSAWAAITCH